MNFKKLNTITAVLALINSAFYLFVPTFSLMLLGQSATPIGLMNTRVAGACALGICAITWLSRNSKEISLQRTVSTGNLIMLAALALIEIHGTLTGTLNWVGWGFIVTDSLLAGAYAILLKKILG